jgi:CRISPR-associated protein Cas6
MTPPSVALQTVVDVAFELGGESVARDHSAALWRALERALPWLGEDEETAVLPIRAARLTGGRLALNRRSRLMLRLPRSRVAAALALCGTRLDLDGDAVEPGRAMTRALIAHPTIYAHRVVTGEEEEIAFMASAERELAALAVRGDFICGQRSGGRGPEGELVGFSVMLTGLHPDESLRVQTAGLGRHRKLGCGIFVPHRATAAIGSDAAEDARRAFR